MRGVRAPFDARRPFCIFAKVERYVFHPKTLEFEYTNRNTLRTAFAPCEQDHDDGQCTAKARNKFDWINGHFHIEMY